jgi:hypothetical protein
MTEGVELKVVVPENKEKIIRALGARPQRALGARPQRALGARPQRREEEDEDNIIDTILKLMEKVEDFIDMNGRQKKNYVLENLKSLIGADSFERYKYFISSFIDFAVSVSKGKKINLNKTRRVALGSYFPHGREYKKKYCCF